MRIVHLNPNETNIEIQTRLGISLPPCYMLINTSSKELWDAHIREGNVLLIKCKPEDHPEKPFEYHVFRLLCLSPEEPKMMLCIAQEHETAMQNYLNYPQGMGEEFLNQEHSYVWLPWYAEGKEWAQEIYRLIPIAVEKHGVIMR